MKKGFTLIELIFVIVVIGIMSVVALPKFTNLKQNAEISNAIKAYSVVQSDLPSAYLNEVELNGNEVTDLSQLMKISPINDQPGKGWYKKNGYYYYYINKKAYIAFKYKKDGSVKIVTRVKGKKADEIKQALTKKIGLVFNGDENTTIVDLTE